MVIFVHYVYLHTRDTYDCVRIVKKKNRTNLPEPCDENLKPNRCEREKDSQHSRG